MIDGVIGKDRVAQSGAEILVTTLDLAQIDVPDFDLSDSDLSESAQPENEGKALPEETPLEIDEATQPDAIAHTQPAITKNQRARAIQEQLQRGVRKVPEGGKVLSRMPRIVGSPIGDIAIGVAVVGVLSITGPMFELWRRKQKAEKSHNGS